jgi:hypothetical protein
MALKCVLALKAVEFDITDSVSNDDVTSHLHMSWNRFAVRLREHCHCVKDLGECVTLSTWAVQ